MMNAAPAAHWEEFAAFFSAMAYGRMIEFVRFCEDHRTGPDRSLSNPPAPARLREIHMFVRKPEFSI